MRTILSLLLFCTSFVYGFAQFANDGGTIVVTESSSLYINMDVQNINQGQIVNQGTLEIVGEMNSELGSTFESSENAITNIQSEVLIPLRTKPATINRPINTVRIPKKTLNYVSKRNKQKNKR